MKNKGEAGILALLGSVGVLAIAAIVVVMVGVNYYVAQVGPGIGGAGEIIIEDLCDDDKLTTVTVSYKNLLNTASDERLTKTCYVYEGTIHTQTITDTDSSPTGVSVNCNTGAITVKCISTAATSTGATVTMGKVYGATVPQFTIQGAQIAGLKMRIFNNDDNAYAKDDGDSSAFQSLDDTWGATGTYAAVAIGADGTASLALHLRTTSTDTQWGETILGGSSVVNAGTNKEITITSGTNSDLKSFVCMDYEITAWDTPVVSYNGVELSQPTSIHAKVTSDGYDTCWILPTTITGKIDTVIGVDLTAASGQNPATDIVFGFVLEGSYLSIDGSTVKTGTNEDDSSFTYTHTAVEAATYNIS